jgi:hypothetical protein
VPAEHVAPHDGRADVGLRLVDDARALVLLAALEAVLLPPLPEREGPLVQAHAAEAERVLDALLGSGDEPVERDGDAEAKAAHGPQA